MYPVLISEYILSSSYEILHNPFSSISVTILKNLVLLIASLSVFNKVNSEFFFKIFAPVASGRIQPPVALVHRRRG